ncbi:UNVERIFIED_CONTAM: SAG-related sequence SRS48Q [Hammondia hammondi]|eukprot:XP_008886606.1 SAG-related sequence SRS48Q [Hammondia hammondi]
MVVRSKGVTRSICSRPLCFLWQRQALLSIMSVAVVVSSLVVVVRCAAAESPLTCKDNSGFLSKSLKNKGESIVFQCPEGLTFVPDVAKQESCEDSACSKKMTLSKEFMTLEPKQQNALYAGVPARTSKASQVTITLHKTEEKSRTLYFLCQTPADNQKVPKNGVDRLPKQPTTCTLQVSVWGSIAFVVPQNQKCATSVGIDATVNSKKQDATFSCGDDTTLTPANFDTAFGGPKCDTEYALTSLGLPKASLVEGNSGTGNKPAYKFSVASLPLQKSVSMCYKCTADAGKALLKSDICTVRVNVEAAQQPPGEADKNDDGQTGGTQSSTEQTTTSAAATLDFRVTLFILKFFYLAGAFDAFV